MYGHTLRYKIIVFFFIVCLWFIIAITNWIFL